MLFFLLQKHFVGCSRREIRMTALEGMHNSRWVMQRTHWYNACSLESRRNDRLIEQLAPFSVFHSFGIREWGKKQFSF